MMPVWLNKIKQNKTTLLQNLGRTGFYWVLPVWKVLVKNCHFMLCLYKEVERNCCNNQLIWKLSISLKILTISKWTQVWFFFFFLTWRVFLFFRCNLYTLSSVRTLKILSGSIKIQRTNQWYLQEPRYPSSKTAWSKTLVMEYFERILSLNIDACYHYISIHCILWGTSIFLL